jgi:hypothetical protein
MKMEDRSESEKDIEERCRGISHSAISVGDRQSVNQLTKSMREQGVAIVSEARETGDG